jgi:hypothetical protein
LSFMTFPPMFSIVVYGYMSQAERLGQQLGG